MPIRPGRSELLAAGGEDGTGVEEILVVGTGVGVGSWSLLASAPESPLLPALGV
jgi:hypothetical protein